MDRERRELGRRPPPAGPAEMPDHIYRYVLATSGWHQLALIVLTVAVIHAERLTTHNAIAPVTADEALRPAS